MFTFLSRYVSVSFSASGFIPTSLLPLLLSLSHTHTKGHENGVNPWQLQWNLTQRLKLGGTREMQYRTVAWPPPANIDTYAPDTGRGHLPAQSQK